RENALERYQLVLHLLRKDPVPRGRKIWENAVAVVRLRNELVHYKSRWGSELDQSKFFRALKNKGHKRPSFITGSANFFPHECLSSSCAAWAVGSCVSFLDAFYSNLGSPGRLDAYRPRLCPEYWNTR